MGTLLVVEGDPVKGTDKHNVAGQATAPSGTVTYKGVGDYQYAGAMRKGLSDFVRIGGTAVAVTDSRSQLDPGESAPPAGRHSGPTGSGFKPTAPTPVPTSLVITDTIGTGTPGAGAGSSFVAAAGSPVLLDGDAIDSCDGLGVTGNSTVSSSTQNFVSASE